MENLNTSEELGTLFKIRKTVLKMLEDRGYIVANKDKAELFEDWKKTFKSKKESLRFLVQKNNDETDYLYVEFSDSPKIGVGDITSFAELLHQQNIRNGVLIIRGGITALAKTVLFF